MFSNGFHPEEGITAHFLAKNGRVLQWGRLPSSKVEYVKEPGAGNKRYQFEILRQQTCVYENLQTVLCSLLSKQETLKVHDLLMPVQLKYILRNISSLYLTGHFFQIQIVMLTSLQAYNELFCCFELIRYINIKIV